jgi:phosphatidylserine/phosphatidylglycerophosphate/cardiolipin synthase-like enzyme
MARFTPAREIDSGLAQSVDPGAWWARGDAPVRVASTLIPLVDGRAAMLAMCVAFLTARERIWLAGWDLYAQLRMVRGTDQRAGPDGSPEQYALIDRLRAAGLDREAIRLWESGGLRVVDVLGFAARRGVRVHFLLWGPFNPGGIVHLINSPRKQQGLLESHGIECRLDTSNRSPLHVAQALHQKCAVVDSQTAFLGGIDLTVQYDGDFDRWDTLAHPFDSEQRSTNLGDARHPWHDGHLMLTGAPAADVERNIRQRWDEANLGWWHQATPPLKHLVRLFLSGRRDSGQHEALQEAAGALPPGAGPQVGGQPARVQVIRTIPALTYRFAPAGVHGIAQAYTLAARQARRFIYLETQYFWLENYIGFNTTKLGWQSHQMRAFLKELAAAAERGVTVAVVLPDHPNVGRALTDATIRWLRRHAPSFPDTFPAGVSVALRATPFPAPCRLEDGGTKRPGLPPGFVPPASCWPGGAGGGSRYSLRSAGAKSVGEREACAPGQRRRAAAFLLPGRLRATRPERLHALSPHLRPCQGGRGR